MAAVSSEDIAWVLSKITRDIDPPKSARLLYEKLKGELIADPFATLGVGFSLDWSSDAEIEKLTRALGGWVRSPVGWSSMHQPVRERDPTVRPHTGDIVEEPINAANRAGRRYPRRRVVIGCKSKYGQRYIVWRYEDMPVHLTHEQLVADWGADVKSSETPGEGWTVVAKGD